MSTSKCSKVTQDIIDKAEAGQLPDCSDRLGPCTLNESREYDTFSDMHQVGLMITEQLQTVDQPTDMALDCLASADFQDDINKDEPKDAWL